MGARVPVTTFLETASAYNEALVWGPLLLAAASSGALPPALATQLRIGGVTAIVSGGVRAALGTRHILDETDTGIADQPARLRYDGFFRG